MTATTALPSPAITAEGAPFWAAANEGRLLLRRCLDTGRAFHPPRDHSPFSGSPRVDWIEASGDASLYAFSYSQRDGQSHCLAYVTLAEGPTLLTAVQVDDAQQLRIGQPLRVRFVASQNGQQVPVFTP